MNRHESRITKCELRLNTKVKFVILDSCFVILFACITNLAIFAKSVSELGAVDRAEVFVRIGGVVINIVLLGLSDDLGFHIKI